MALWNEDGSVDLNVVEGDERPLAAPVVNSGRGPVFQVL